MAESGEPRGSSPRSSRVQAERAALAASLETLDWRMLSWLLRYPFQRADDLVVGLAHWTSRATVYRHLHRLEQDGLITSVLPKTPAEGKRLYHLHNLGVHMLAAQLGTPARTLARDWQSDEAGLLRLVPRLPTLLCVQDIVNGLVIHAADALTMQGRRPTLVRWNWQRDLSHRFRFRERTMRLFVDGALALCVETAQAEGISEEHWYGLLLLATDLEEEQLMRLRLERLLCWRECPERWSQYQQMLPVLMLAHSARQRYHWQRALEQAMQRVQVAPLVGAITIMPAAARQSCNPWQLDWRTLSTTVGCHVPDLLHSIPVTALPPALRPAGDATEGTGTCFPSHPTDVVSTALLPTRLSRIIREQLPDRLIASTQDQVGEPEMLAWLTWRVTPGQWEIMQQLLAHPLLSTEELAVLLHLQRHSVRCALSALHHCQCIVPAATVVVQRWHLDEWGLRLLAAANRVPLHTLAIIPDTTPATAASVSRTVVQRGVPWLLEHCEHTAGVYSFFTRLVQATTHLQGQALCWWETGARCECRYRVNEHWYNLRPDALAAYGAGQHPRLFWLEWDRGTMNVRDLTVKFTAYAHYVVSREWSRHHRVLPQLLCIAPDIAQEQRLARVAQETLATAPECVLSTTTAPLLLEYGPLAAIWVPVLPHHQQPEGRRRQAVFVERTTDHDTSTRGEV
jgi:predicted transcriptional regulator